MHRLVPALVHEMGDTYHELQRAQPLITETLLLEERRFKKTLEKGLGLLGEASGKLKKGDVLPGETAFKLYDTYGFPLDLTEDALRARGVSVDTKGFDAAMERQKAEARKDWKGSGEAATESVWFEIKEKTGATEFLGYDTETAAGEIVTLVKDGKEAKSLKAGDEAAIIVNQTPFYGESGGQVGDEGVIRGAKGAVFRVTDTQKKAGALFVHLGKVESGSFKKGEVVDLEVDHASRTANPRQPFGDPPPARGVAPSAWAARRAEGIAGRGGSPALRFLAYQADDGRGDRRGRGARQRHRAAERAGRDAPDGDRGRDAVGRAWRCSARSTATRCASCRWATRGPTPTRRGRSSCAAARMPSAPATSASSRFIAETASASGVRRIEAFTAEAARAYLERSGCAPQGSRRGATRAPRGCGGARQSAGGGKKATRAPARRRQEANRHGRRRQGRRAGHRRNRRPASSSSCRSPASR